MTRPTLSLPVTRWEIAETRAANQLLKEHRLMVKPMERLARTVAAYLKDIHLPQRSKQHD